MLRSDEIEKELISYVSFGSAQEINIPKSSEFVFNSRGLRLHVRTFFPRPQDIVTTDKTNKNKNASCKKNGVLRPRAIIFALHGFGVHANHPVHRIFAREFNKQNLAYVTLDFHAHGHSEARRVSAKTELRYYVEQFEDLGDDVLSVITALYSYGHHQQQPQGPADRCVLNVPYVEDNDAKALMDLSDIPFFIMGQSMGGAAALSTAIELHAHAYHLLSSSMKRPHVHHPLLTSHPNVSSLFAGAILCCPAIDLKPPSPLVTTILKAFIIPLWGNRYVPSLLSPPEFPPTTLTKRPELHRYREIDTIHPSRPGALGGEKDVLFQTAESLLNMSSHIKSIIQHIRQQRQQQRKEQQQQEEEDILLTHTQVALRVSFFRAIFFVCLRVMLLLFATTSPSLLLFWYFSSSSNNENEKMEVAVIVTEIVLWVVLPLMYVAYCCWTAYGRANDFTHKYLFLSPQEEAAREQAQAQAQAREGRAKQASAAAAHVLDFPFIVFHDENDKIVPFRGSQMLIDAVAGSVRTAHTLAEGSYKDVVTGRYHGTGGNAMCNDVVIKKSRTTTTLTETTHTEKKTITTTTTITPALVATTTGDNPSDKNSMSNGFVPIEHQKTTETTTQTQTHHTTKEEKEEAEEELQCPRGHAIAANNSVNLTSISYNGYNNKMSRRQELVVVPGGLHDLYATSTATIINYALDFVHRVLRPTDTAIAAKI